MYKRLCFLFVVILCAWKASAQTTCVGRELTEECPVSGSRITWSISSGGVLLSGAGACPVRFKFNTPGTHYLYFKDRENSGNDLTYTFVVEDAVPTVGALTPATSDICAGSNVTLNLSSYTGTSVSWQKRIEGTADWVTVMSNKSTTYSETNVQQSSEWRVVVTSPCGSVTSNTATVNAMPLPEPPVNVTESWVYGRGSATLKVTVANSGYRVTWYAGADGTGIAVASGLVYTTPELLTSTVYSVRSTNSKGCKSLPAVVVAQFANALAAPSTAKSEVVRIAGVKDGTQVDRLSDSEKVVQFTHLDGLGRTIQSIIHKGSAVGTDIIQPVEYDALGRSTKQYLPYAGGTDGSFKASYQTDQLAFYAAANDKVANDTHPYAITSFEDSPLDRIIEQGAPGQAWQPGTKHTLRMAHSFNTGVTNNVAEEIRQFKADGSSTGFYAANTLRRTQSTNENSAITIVYANAEGQLIARKVQLDETIDGALVTYLETYYIYDDLGRMKYILSPNAVSALKKAGWVMSTTILDQYAHQFVYDARGRIVEKKVPGQAWQYYVYDKLNRIVLTQDGVLRAQNKWAFVKYDSRHRPIMQGLYLNTTQTTRTAVQNLVANLYKASNTVYPANAWHESRGTTLHGYTNISFPKTNANNSALEILSVNFYDTYDFDDPDAADDFAYVNQGMAGEEAQLQAPAYGMPTGSKRLVMGTTLWLYQYVFFDKYGRVIQTRNNNHLNPIVNNLATSVYAFDGRVMATKTYHTAGTGKETTVVNKMEYDVQGRLVKIYQNNNNAAMDQLLVQYEYNALGQLVDKKLHNTTGTTFLQSIDYRYNIRGWLTSINNAQLTTDQVLNDDPNDYFGMEIAYNIGVGGLVTTPQFNGNICAIKWKGPEAFGAADQKSYKFEYDKDNKLKTATYQVYTTSWNKEVGAYNENVSYDQNGNIRKLQRNERKHQFTGALPEYAAQSIDDLTYTYNTTQGEQLLKVDDAAAHAAGFNNGESAATNDYTYDVNGNLTADKNKGISSIAYNVLGKPSVVTFSDGRKIEYTYDASGVKLTMKNYQGTTLQLTTDYVGSFVYENGALSFFGSPEGRVAKNGSALEYQYAIADYQGNTRVVFSSINTTEPVATATFEGNTNDGAAQYQNINASNVETFVGANHTSGGTKVVRLDQNYKIGPARNLKVYPGDKVSIEVWEYHEGTAGFGTTGSPLTTLITQVAAAFNGVPGGPAESGQVYSGVEQALTGFGTGGTQGDSRPAAYLNYILFDRHYKVVDMGWQLAPAATFTKQKLVFNNLTIKEMGYMFIYLSYESDSPNRVYFDDFKVTHTKSNVIQYNQYYPFGLQTSNSWTRDNQKNNYLYNGGTELNATSGWYETVFRGYDPAVGRFMQVDPLATSSHHLTPYHYAGNNPVNFNDPLGLEQVATPPMYVDDDDMGGGLDGGFTPIRSQSPMVPTSFLYGWSPAVSGPGSGHHWADGIRYSDWTFSQGSATYRKGLAMGLTDLGGVLYRQNKDRSYSKFDIQNGRTGFWEDEGFIEYWEEDGKLHSAPGVRSRFVETGEGQQGGQGEHSPNSVYTVRSSDVNYRNLYDEFISGTGPEYSLFLQGHPMINDLKTSVIMLDARRRFERDPSKALIRYDAPFGVLAPIAEGPNMTAQFLGGARVTIIPYSFGNMVIVDNTTGRYSYYAHMAKDIARQPGKIVPEGTIYQRFIWFESK